MLENGILVVDKPQGVTSHDVVAACRRLLHTSKVGHAGTLDPMATGVLVIGFGFATRLLNAIVGTDKMYEATIRLGARTTTDDADGEIIDVTSGEQQKIHDVLSTLTSQDIEEIIARHLMGDIEQIPSTYSAKKVAGKRAYELARQGEEVHLAPSKIRISDFTLLDIRSHKADIVDIDVRVTCSAGTYIRALARDLGGLLQVGGYLTRLRRLRVGSFNAEESYIVPVMTETRTFTPRNGQETTRTYAVFPQDLYKDQDILDRYLIAPEKAVEGIMPLVQLDEKQAIDISFGRPLSCDIHELSAAIYDSHLMALIEPWRKHLAKPSTVFITSNQLTALKEEK